MSEQQAKIAQLFAAASVAFATACQRVAPLEHWLSVGETTVRATFAGAGMLPDLLPALAHLQIERRGQADLDLCIFDSASTGVPLVAPAWAEDDYVARGEIRGGDGEIAVSYHPGSGILTLFHHTQRTAIVWRKSAENIPYYEHAAPLRTLLHWWATHNGQQMVHGAAVGTANGALLLTGKGGSGKSTTAVNSLLSQLDYYGDDYVLCGLEPPRVFAIYNSVKVDANTVAMFPQLEQRLVYRPNSADEKAVLMANDLFPLRVQPSAPLRAILIPTVTDAPTTTIHPLKSTLAFLALAPTTVFQLPGARETATRFLRELVTQLPCYQLQLGADIDDIPRLLADFLTTL